MTKKHSKSSKQHRSSSEVSFDTSRPKIIKALNSGRFVARTVAGIAKETSLTRPVVVKALKGDMILRSEVKVLPRKTRDGRILVTTKNHFSEKAGFKDKFIDVFATKRVTLDDIS